MCLKSFTDQVFEWYWAVTAIVHFIEILYQALDSEDLHVTTIHIMALKETYAPDPKVTGKM